MWKTILSWFTGPIGSILSAIIPYVIAILVLVGTYFYAHHKGYTQAQSLCNSSVLQSTIEAKDIQIKNLNAQINDDSKIIADLKDKKANIIYKDKVVEKVIHDKVKDNPVCDIPLDVIDSLNKQRDTSK